MSNAEDSPPNLAFYLPYGELLRTFLDQGFITPTEIRQVLRQRGVFLPEYDKPTSIPHLAFATVTPREFEILLETQRHREESSKSLDGVIAWDSTKSIAEAMPSEEELAGFIEQQRGTKVTFVSGVIFVGNDPNHVRIEYEIERTNLHKSWSTDRTPHRGNFEIRKTGTGKEAAIEIVSTIPETRTFGKAVVKEITNSFRLNGHVPFNAKKKIIHFASFDNAKRVEFFMSLTAPDVGELEFKAITDSEIAPDDKLSLPAEIKPFLQEIKKMRLSGSQLQESLLLKKAEYHPFVILSGLTIRYSFDYHAAKGTCVADFRFVGYPNAKSLHEFETEVGVVTFDDPQPANRSVVRLYVERLVNNLARTKSLPYLTEV